MHSYKKKKKKHEEEEEKTQSRTFEGRKKLQRKEIINEKVLGTNMNFVNIASMETGEPFDKKFRKKV